MTLCLLAGTSAFAQDRRAPRTKERPTAEQMAQRKTDRMVEKLNLNEDQSKQLYELNLQEVKDMQAQHERMRAARKAKAEGLTDAEIEERAALRQEYLNAVMANARSVLENTYIVDEKGNKRKLRGKGEGEA